MSTLPPQDQNPPADPTVAPLHSSHTPPESTPQGTPSVAGPPSSTQHPQPAENPVAVNPINAGKGSNLPATDEPLLYASGLSFAYGSQPVLKDVSLTAQRGQITALLGPNGSGKSTLIRQLLGQVKGQGEVHWMGKPLRKWSRRALSRQVAYLPQSPAAEMSQTVGEILALGRTPYLHSFGLESANDRKIIHQAADLLDLTPFLDRLISSLSGGQRQRVFVGRCLVQEPRVLMLDEPNTFLDLRHQVELCQLLQRLARSQNIAIVMALHDLNLAAAYADQVVLLHEGRVAGSGSPDQVLKADLLAKVFGLPLHRLDLPEVGHPVVLPIQPR